MSANLDTAYHHSAVGSPKLFSVQSKVRMEYANGSLRRILGMHRRFGVLWGCVFMLDMSLRLVGDTSACSKGRR